MMDRLAALATTLTGRLQSDEGQSFVEYALILVIVVVGMLLTITFTGLATAVQNAVTQVSNAFGA